MSIKKRQKNIFFVITISIVAVFVLLPAISIASVLAVLTDPASNAEETRAQLNGYVSVSNVEWAEVWFEYGKTSGFENTTYRRTIKNDARTFSERVSGLEPNTTYFARIVARDTSGTFRGNTVTFQTVPTTYDLSSVSTYSAREIDDDSALVRGYVNAHGDMSARVWFEWGSETSLGNSTPFINQDGTGQTAVSLVKGLSANTRYYYRIVATNEAGTAYGDIRYFDTGKISDAVSKGEPSVTTGTATLLSDGEVASLSGFVDPERVPTETWFEWGETTSLGNTTRRSAKRTNTGSFSETISGLKKGVLYYYRGAAQNENGTAYGLVKTVTGGGATEQKVSVSVGVGTLFAPKAETSLAQTPSATNILLRGIAQTGGDTATAWFEWGTTASLGNTTAVQTIGALPTQGVSASIFNATPSTTYYYRLGVRNSQETSYGSIRSVNTPSVFVTPAVSESTLKSEPIPNTPEPEPFEPAAAFFGADIFGKYTPEWILSIFFIFVLGLIFFRKI